MIKILSFLRMFIIEIKLIVFLFDWLSLGVWTKPLSSGEIRCENGVLGYSTDAFLCIPVRCRIICSFQASLSWSTFPAYFLL